MRQNPGKKCNCRVECNHDVWLRFKHEGVRQRVNLSKVYPGEAIEVGAARARDDIRKGLVVRGQRVVPTVTKPTVECVREKYCARSRIARTTTTRRWTPFVTSWRTT